MTTNEEQLKERLSDLVNRCKEIALLIGEGEEVHAECAYCRGPVALWEALFTQQLSGVLAHISCPREMLSQVAGEAAPLPEFDYEGLIEAVDRRMETDHGTARAGVIEVADR